MCDRAARIRAHFQQYVPRGSLKSNVAHVWVLRRSGCGGAPVSGQTNCLPVRSAKGLHGRRLGRQAFRADCEQLERLYRDRFGGFPQLADGGAGMVALCTSRSYSADTCVYAIASSARIGVDLEFIDPDRQPGFALQACMSGEEKSVFDRLSASSSSDAARWAYQCWSAKEAYLKATGVGVRSAMDRVDLPWRDHSGARGSSWAMQSLDVGTNFVCVLVTDREVTIQVLQDSMLSFPDDLGG